MTDLEHKTCLLNTHFRPFFTHEDYKTLNVLNSPFPPIPPLDISTIGIQKLQRTLDAKPPNQIPTLILRSLPLLLSYNLFSLNLSCIHISDFVQIPPPFQDRRPTEPTSYRSIFLILIVCKIFEHRMHKHSMNQMDVHNILTDSQHGFRPKRSRETQLITTHHDNARQLDRRDNKYVDTILLDFDPQKLET